MKQLLIIPSLALLLLGYSTSSCSSSSADKAQNDSIEAAELEAACLDSIRQDSINRRNFTTPDLAFNELHGHVEKCEWGKETDLYYSTVYSYSNDGILDKGKGEYTHVYTRDRDGQIVTDEEDFAKTDYKWSDNKVVSSKLVSCEGETAYGNGATHYFYDADGLLAYTTTDDGVGEMGSMRNMKTVYSDYQFDDIGNWISRTSTKTYQTDEFGDGSWQNHKDTNKEVRVITYYDSEIGKDREGLLSKLHEQKVNGIVSEQKQEQEDKKGPEWINGIWEVNTNVSTEMGVMRVSAKVCIDRDSQQIVATDCGSTVARGIYRISGNSIYCGDLYIEMDLSNQRLEYGNGVYYRKISNKYL